jgi:hypothetical protein
VYSSSLTLVQHRILDNITNRRPRHQITLQLERESHARKKLQAEATKREQLQGSSPTGEKFGFLRSVTSVYKCSSGQKIVELENCINSMQNRMLVLEKCTTQCLTALARCQTCVIVSFVCTPAYEAKDSECKELKGTCSELSKRKKMFEDMYNSLRGAVRMVVCQLLHGLPCGICVNVVQGPGKVVGSGSPGVLDRGKPAASVPVRHHVEVSSCQQLDSVV